MPIDWKKSIPDSEFYLISLFLYAVFRRDELSQTLENIINSVMASLSAQKVKFNDVSAIVVKENGDILCVFIALASRIDR
jgi:hypothetical protein